MTAKKATANTASFDAKETLRAALRAANPALSNQELDGLVDQATGKVAARAQAGTPKKLEHPIFKEPPRYRLLEKAFFPTIKVKQEGEFVPLTDVVLDPEEQPFLQQLSGPFGGRGNAKRHPLEIQYDGIPDDHMEPLNEAAEWMMDHIDELKTYFASQRKAKRGRRDPVEALSIVGQGAEVLKPAQDSV